MSAEAARYRGAGDTAVLKKEVRQGADLTHP